MSRQAGRDVELSVDLGYTSTGLSGWSLIYDDENGRISFIAALG